MPNDNNIADLFKIITQERVSTKPVIAEVIEVNGHLCDCDPIDDSGTLFDVRLQTSDDSGVLIVPKVGSKVIVTMVNTTLGYVSCYGEVEEIIFLNGDNGGVVKVSDLVTKLNNLENDINNLKSLIGAWVPVLGDGGTALKTALTTWFGDPLTPTTESELENDKFKH